MKGNGSGGKAQRRSTLIIHHQRLALGCLGTHLAPSQRQWLLPSSCWAELVESPNRWSTKGIQRPFSQT